MAQLNLIDSHLERVEAPTSQVPSSLHSNGKKEQGWAQDSEQVPGVRLEKPELDLEPVNRQLADAKAPQIVKWAAETFGDGLVMSTSFGIQSAVMLHIVTRTVPNIPVIWVDTGYLPPETYIFAEELTERLKLNLKVYQSPISPARMEALYGKLWTQDDVEALNRYDRMRKVEPMQRALRELKATAWLAGLRSNQTNHRKTLQFVSRQGEQYKVLPILHWNSKDIYEYLTAQDLPYHPFFDKGYVSVGDWHSSRPLTADDENERDTRFHGLKQECGLHLPLTPGEAKSLDSSTL
ncbi:MAG: phosphoadenosine phosphosulfate reductase [Xenococcaceae cyanobacterium]